MNEDDQAKINELENRIATLEEKLDQLITTLKEKDMVARQGTNPLDIHIK